MGTVERYVHSIPKKNRNWNQDYVQFVSIDPGQMNFAFRIERRYYDGRIVPIAFWKEAFKSNTYQKIFARLEEFEAEYLNTHIILIEKQPPRNMTINRIMQHALTYFMTKTKDYPLLPEINEVQPHLKGNELGCRPDENLKKWAAKKARELLHIRGDDWSINVMDYWLDKSHPKGQKKDDDLADTIVMIEAYCKKKGFPLTKFPPPPVPLPPIKRVNVVVNRNIPLTSEASCSTSTRPTTRKIIIRRVVPNNK